MHVALGDLEIAVPGEQAHRLDARASPDERRAERVTERVERSRRQRASQTFLAGEDVVPLSDDDTEIR
jgi:hypothetical protein